MARRCDIYPEKKTAAGNNVSHSNRKVKRTFKANLHTKTYKVLNEETGALKRIKLKLSRKAIRLIDKLGIETVLERIQH